MCTPGRAWNIVSLPVFRLPPRNIQSYKGALSKPILQRIDLKVLVYDAGDFESFDYSTQTIRNKISKVRQIQERRYRNVPNISCNADVPDRSQFRHIHPNTQAYVKDLYKNLDISPRTEVKILLVAQTIADLNDSTRITRKHINKAVDLMGLNSPYFKYF